MIEIREANSADLPEIVTLLKKSLGEETLPKSESYFIWKHFQNPFGPSKILLAVDNEKIVGLRAFMRWRWVMKGDLMEAVRAVDTATLPDNQGKGIFRQLTMQAAAECKEEGIAMVFNTPNTQSMPGYLKMGWHKAGKMPLYISPGSLVPRLYSEKRVSDILNDYDTVKVISGLPEDWKLPHAPNVFHTPLSKPYLLWRYAHCPVARYGAIIEPGQFGFVFRLKKLNRFVEMRICELWTEQNGMHQKARLAYRKLLRIIRPVMVSAAESPLFHSPGKRPLGLIGPFRKGPETTIKSMGKEKLKNFERFVQWQPSLGTMELF